MRLIVTEKNNSAKKIAEILSGGAAKADATYKVPYYSWGRDGDAEMTVGLKGHVLNPAFPEGYSNWQETDPKSLIDAELVSEPTDKNVVKAVKKLAKEADSIVIATDFDREGELIGLEALREILAVNPGVEGTVKRARYSALTRDEIERAFAELDELSHDLAHAAQARGEIDLIWGASPTAGLVATPHAVQPARRSSRRLTTQESRSLTHSAGYRRQCPGSHRDRYGNSSPPLHPPDPSRQRPGVAH